VQYLAKRYGFASGSNEHLRAVLERFDLKKLTTQAETILLKILEKKFPYVDEFIKQKSPNERLHLSAGAPNKELHINESVTLDEFNNPLLNSIKHQCKQ